MLQRDSVGVSVVVVMLDVSMFLYPSKLCDRACCTFDVDLNSSLLVLMFLGGDVRSLALLARFVLL